MLVLRMDWKDIEDTYTVSYRTDDQIEIPLGNYVAEIWRNSRRKVYRPFDEPSYVAHDPETGNVTCMLWTDREGRWHRDNGKPACIWMGQEFQLRWYTHGKFTHLSNATEIECDPETGAVRKLGFDGPILPTNPWEKPPPFYPDESSLQFDFD